MKLFLTLAILSISFIASSSEVDDAFNTGNKEFKFERFSNEGILLAIDQDASIACSPDGQCLLSSTKSDSKGWEVSFNMGKGNNGYTGQGTTIFTGGYNPYGTNNSELSFGANIAYRVGHCTQKVMVPRSLFYALNRYMYGLMQDTGETKKGFTPADETMIMFYTTIAKQATSGCTSTGR